MTTQAEHGGTQDDTRRGPASADRGCAGIEGSFRMVDTGPDPTSSPSPAPDGLDLTASRHPGV
jgi:hypothetical protein